MARAKLTDAEREARRKERVKRSFSDAAYQHYDVKALGYGSRDEWMAAADAMASGKGALRFSTLAEKADADLEMLMLDSLPPDVAGLKTAFRNAMFLAHPDHGGTNEAARDTMAAYKRLLERY